MHGFRKDLSCFSVLRLCLVAPLKVAQMLLHCVTGITPNFFTFYRVSKGRVSVFQANCSHANSWSHALTLGELTSRAGAAPLFGLEIIKKRVCPAGNITVI